MEYTNFVLVEKDTGMKNNIERFKQLKDNLSYQIDYTSNFNKSFRREFQSKYINNQITPDEFSILYALYFVPDISQSELATLLFKGKAHIGKILNDMESRGLLTRTADTKNNMIIKRNELTEKGKQIFLQGHKEFEKIKILAEKTFSNEEIAQFINFLKRYRELLTTFVDVKLK